MKTNIPDNILPTNMADPNSLTTTYTTNVMYPKLGPLAVNRYVRVIAGLLRDYAASVSLVRRVKDYQELFDIPVTVIEQPKDWLKEIAVFKPMLESNDTYLKTFIADLSEFRSPQINLNIIAGYGKKNISTNVRPSDNSNLVGSNIARDTRIRTSSMFTRNPIVVLNGNTENHIGAVSDMGIGELELLDGRVIAEPITPVKLMHITNTMSENISEGGTVKVDEKTTKQAEEQQKRAYMLGNIMHGLSRVNTILPDMIDKKIINVKGSLLNKTFLDNKYLDNIAKALDELVTVDPARMKEVAKLVDQALTYLEKLGLKNDKFIRKYRKDTTFKKRVQRYIIGKMDTAKPIDASLVPLPDDTDIINSREWAFQRTERLELILGKPVLRGPFNAESVSPNSELTIAESFTSEQFNLSETITGQSQASSTERASFTSSRFQSALSNMTENGISDENSFNNEQTLLNTLRERRREVIDRTLTSISHENEQRAVSVSSVSTSTSRSYTTRGKDASFSTTELAFQVSAPVQAKVFLEDVNMVWAPSVPSPFLRLHNIIENYESSSEFEYREQNIVIDPVRPIEIYDRQTIKKELSIRGRDRYQSKTFNIPIDAIYSNDGWGLDKAASTISFRNGTGDDYNWDESWNWDDLENWSTSFKSIYQEGDHIKGEAVLETTDPEYFNKGFLVLQLVMRRLSEQSRADLRAYAAEQSSVEAERSAVFSRARQYAKLRREELITKYQGSIDLREEAYNALIAQVFQGISPNHYGYYKEIIYSSINWSNATIHFEANSANNLPYPEFSRSHFMNSSGIRFILPIKRTAEDAFFESLGKNGNDYYRTSANKVREFTDKYRERVEDLKSTSPDSLILDDYTREIVIGRHLEAVMSKHPFKE